MSNPFRAKNREAGQSIVEFIVSLFTALFIIFCCWELLMAIYTSNVMGDAAKEGVRYAIVHGSTGGTTCDNSKATGKCSSDPFNITGVVNTYAKASLHDISGITISVSYPDGTNDPPNRILVSVTYAYVPYVSLPFFHPTLTTSAEGRIVY